MTQARGKRGAISPQGMRLQTAMDWIARIVRDPVDLAIGTMAVIGLLGVAALVLTAFP